MKVGAVYNIFQGSEILPYSIKQIRNEVDIIIGCVQLTSWTNRPIKDKDISIIRQLLKDKLIDRCFYYTPTFKASSKQEQTHKSELCRQELIKENCTHFIILDSDEIYLKDQFKQAKETFIKSGLLASACEMETYYKEPIYKLVPRVNFHVPFMYKVTNRPYKLSANFPLIVDNSRKIETSENELLTFDNDKLLMHHFSYVRHDLNDKTLNSTNRKRYSKEFDNLVQHWQKWKFPNEVLIGVNKKYNVREVENIFNIEL